MPDAPTSSTPSRSRPTSCSPTPGRSCVTWSAWMTARRQPAVSPLRLRRPGRAAPLGQPRRRRRRPRLLSAVGELRRRQTTRDVVADQPSRPRSPGISSAWSDRSHLDQGAWVHTWTTLLHRLDHAPEEEPGCGRAGTRQGRPPSLGTSACWPPSCPALAYDRDLQEDKEPSLDRQRHFWPCSCLPWPAWWAPWS